MPARRSNGRANHPAIVPERSLPLPGLANRVHHLGAAPPLLEQQVDRLRRIAQVGVQHDHGVALGVIEAGGQCDLEPEASG